MNRVAFIENGTDGAINTAPASNMTSIKNSTCLKIAIGKGATSRPSMNCLGKKRRRTTPRGSRAPRAAKTTKVEPLLLNQANFFNCTVSAEQPVPAAGGGD